MSSIGTGENHTTMAWDNISHIDNRTVIFRNWTNPVIGCFTWTSPNHFLFQLANCVLLIALFAPDGKKGILFMHGFFVLGFLLLSVWSWVVLCAPDFFSWNFSFMVLNAVQTLFLMYHIRPVKFCDELEQVYVALFQPMRIPRHLFKKLVSTDYCTLTSLHEGEAYATQGISKTDRLGLLMSGKMNVYSHNNLLHQIHEKEFIDSPEFESGIGGDEKYQVSIFAGSMCRYIFWSRHSLEYLLIKESYLANVFNIILGRDITNKLYALNEKVALRKGSRVDIRLPSVSSSLKAKQDLRKTVAGVGDESPSHAPHTIIDDTGDDDVYIDESVEDQEKEGLLNGHLRQPYFRGPSLSTCSEFSRGESPRCSINSHSSNSGIHIKI
ncbi:BVES [Mytilus coruscus]|uniref:BVES n=1 Tax=Mytilus coruscus TaxID=42192 RepID=A0A6J8DMM4_MYTCO|nr:BVES [Mytilus coruscus]